MPAGTVEELGIHGIVMEAKSWPMRLHPPLPHPQPALSTHALRADVASNPGMKGQALSNMWDPSAELLLSSTCPGLLARFTRVMSTNQDPPAVGK